MSDNPSLRDQDQSDAELEKMIESLRPKHILLKTVLLVIGVLAVTVGTITLAFYLIQQAKPAINDLARNLVGPTAPVKAKPVPKPAVSPGPKTAPLPALQRVAPQDSRSKPDRVINISLALPAGLRLPKAVRQVTRHIRPITVGYSGNYTEVGTATLIGDNILLTCNHLFMGRHSGDRAKQIETFCAAGQAPTSMNSLVRDEASDVALVRTDCSSQALTFRTAPPRHGEVVYLLGIDYDFKKLVGRLLVRRTRVDLRLSLSRLTAKHYPPATASAIARAVDLMIKAGLQAPVAVNTTVRPGNSGSLVVDANGRIVGMIFAGRGLPKGFFTPSYNIGKFAKAVMPLLNKRPATPARQGGK